MKRCSKHDGEEKCIKGFGRSLEEKDNFKDLGIGGVILKRILKKQDGSKWTVSTCLKIEITGRLL
jgi:hypothetical protein